jgi:hypothetical protein
LALPGGKADVEKGNDGVLAVRNSAGHKGRMNALIMYSGMMPLVEVVIHCFYSAYESAYVELMAHPYGADQCQPARLALT